MEGWPPPAGGLDIAPLGPSVGAPKLDSSWIEFFLTDWPINQDDAVERRLRFSSVAAQAAAASRRSTAGPRGRAWNRLS